MARGVQAHGAGAQQQRQPQQLQQRRAAEEQRRRSLAREREDGGGGAAERLTEEQREEQRTDNRAACGSSARTWGSISPTRRAGRQPLQGALWGQGLERGGTGSLHPGECCLGADRRFGLAAVGERARGVQRRLRHCDSSSTSSAAQSVARTAVAPSSMGLFAEVVDGHDGVADLVPRLICFLLERAPRLMCARQVGPPLRRNVHRLLPRLTGQRREWQPGSRGGSGPFPGRPLGHEASLAAWCTSHGKCLPRVRPYREGRRQHGAQIGGLAERTPRCDVQAQLLDRADAARGTTRSFSSTSMARTTAAIAGSASKTTAMARTAAAASVAALPSAGAARTAAGAKSVASGERRSRIRAAAPSFRSRIRTAGRDARTGGARPARRRPFFRREDHCNRRDGGGRGATAAQQSRPAPAATVAAAAPLMRSMPRHTNEGVAGQ